MNKISEAFACLDEALFEEQMEKVETLLAAVRREGRLPVKGGELYYELYPRREARAAIVICHGFCESSEKYWEFIHYLYSAGYQVAVFDQRGHGKSLRESVDAGVVHVEDFEDYVEDLHFFLEDVVKKMADGGPLYLYAHSMGGCVGARYLEKYPADFQKAVLNTPMLAIYTGPCPLSVAKAVCDMAKLFGRGKKRLFTQGVFRPDMPFAKSCSDSEVRYCYYQKKRRQNSCYQTSAASYTWGSTAIRAGYRAVSSKNASQVSIPVLLCQAGRDRQVKAPAQRKFIKRVQNGKLCVYPDSKHELYRAGNAVLKPYMENILEFFG
ncbi:MAG: alpha/beta hydrolase [Lachnospiraceae bacterium]|nr:alpha/beta hydrolase [Lachnospiraceae bacterium]